MDEVHIFGVFALGLGKPKVFPLAGSQVIHPELVDQVLRFIVKRPERYYDVFPLRWIVAIIAIIAINDLVRFGVPVNELAIDEGSVDPTDLLRLKYQAIEQALESILDFGKSTAIRRMRKPNGAGTAHVLGRWKGEDRLLHRSAASGSGSSRTDNCGRCKWGSDGLSAACRHRNSHRRTPT